MNRLRIFADLDDTIFDFKGEFQRRKHEHEFPQSKYGFFLNLKPLPDAIESVKKLMEDHDVWFASRPSFYNPLSYTEKRVCIENHFGFDVVSKLILIPNKGLLKGDILIDDSISDGQLDFEGSFFHFGVDEVSKILQDTPNKKVWDITATKDWSVVLDKIKFFLTKNKK